MFKTATTTTAKPPQNCNECFGKKSEIKYEYFIKEKDVMRSPLPQFSRTEVRHMGGS